MDLKNIINTPQFLDNALTPPAKEIGITLGNIFYAIFSPINYNAEKLRIKLAENLKKYEADIQRELSKIPEEKLVEPPMSIVGPAIEASKYYIDHDEMRKMYSKLIASSMNIDYTKKTHHAYVEIIKELSPLDASNLQFIYKLKYLSEYDLVFSETSDETHLQAVSLNNLIRLGLVEKIRQDPNIKLVDRNMDGTYFDNYPDYELKICGSSVERDQIYITSFGDDFCEICLNDDQDR